jgi:hypothetical protein
MTEIGVRRSALWAERGHSLPMRYVFCSRVKADSHWKLRRGRFSKFDKLTMEDNRRLSHNGFIQFEV